MSILEVKNLTHTYSGNTPFVNDAVKDVSFKVEKGEIIGIIGHTGSGKSTLVQHLNGLLKPTEGKVLIEDTDIWEKPSEIRKIRSRVGLVFQYPEYQLFEETVEKDIAFGPKNMGLNAEEIDRRNHCHPGRCRCSTCLCQPKRGQKCVRPDPFRQRQRDHGCLGRCRRTIF